MFAIKYSKLIILGFAVVSLSMISMSAAYAGKKDKSDDERREDTIKGAVIGAGVGALVDGSDGAAKGAAAGAIIGRRR